MTILDNPTRAQYTATSAQTEFIYNFEIFDQNDLDVYNGETLLAIGTDYTVSGVNVETGGTVTLTTGATAGDIITIERNMALSRDSDYATSGDYTAEQVNTDLDKLWAAIQQIRAANDLTVSLPTTTTATLPAQLPNAAADNVLGWDSTGSIIENKTLTELSVGIQALIDTGLDVVRNSITPSTPTGRLTLNRPNLENLQINPVALTGTNDYTSNITPANNGVYCVLASNANTETVITIDGISVFKIEFTSTAPLKVRELNGIHFIYYSSSPEPSYIVLNPRTIIKEQPLSLLTATEIIKGYPLGFNGFSSSEATNFSIENGGTKLYVLNTVIRAIIEFNLSIPYDISSASPSGDGLDYNSLGVDVYSFAFSAPDQIILVNGTSSQLLYEYNLTANYDFSNPTLGNTVDVSSDIPVTNGIRDIIFSSTKDKMFLILTVGNVYEFSLGTSGNITTKSYTSNTIDLLPTSTLFGVSTDLSGTILLVTSGNVSEVQEFRTKTAWDFTSATEVYDTGRSVNYQHIDSNIQKAIFSPDGKKLYLLASENSFIYQMDSTKLYIES